MEELLKELGDLGKKVIFLGDGVPVFQEMIAEKCQVPWSFAPAHLNRQRAGAVAALGAVYYKAGRSRPRKSISRNISECPRRKEKERKGWRNMEKIEIRRMREQDVSQAAAIEKENFSLPWTEESFQQALEEKREYLSDGSGRRTGGGIYRNVDSSG